MQETTFNKLAEALAKLLALSLDPSLGSFGSYLCELVGIFHLFMEICTLPLFELVAITSKLAELLVLELLRLLLRVSRLVMRIGTFSLLILVAIVPELARVPVLWG